MKFNPLSPATMKFVPNDKSKKSIKADTWKEKQGYCCEKCNNIVVIIKRIILENGTKLAKGKLKYTKF